MESWGRGMIQIEEADLILIVLHDLEHTLDLGNFILKNSLHTAKQGRGRRWAAIAGPMKAYFYDSIFDIYDLDVASIHLHTRHGDF